MHVLIALITAVVSLLYALERLGIDVGWINPWAWRRKRKWLKQYHASPAFSLTTPMDAIALLLAATAKIDGDLTLEEKAELKRIFEQEFKQDPRQASELLGSSVYLMSNCREVFDRPKDVLEPSLDKFTADQRQSSLQLLNRIALVGGDPSPIQTDFIEKIASILSPPKDENSWG